MVVSSNDHIIIQSYNYISIPLEVGDRRIKICKHTFNLTDLIWLDYYVKYKYENNTFTKNTKDIISNDITHNRNTVEKSIDNNECNTITMEERTRRKYKNNKMEKKSLNL